MAPGVRSDGAVPVNAFHVGDSYLFKHYFEGEAVFDRLRRYYDNTQYRFAVPTEEFDGVRRFLADRGYALDPVTSLDDYAVVVRKYTAHPDDIFKTSVLQRSHGDYNLFVLTDENAVAEAVADGGTRLADSPLSVTLGSQMRLSAAEG
ncbi:MULTISPECIES: hypothetical protein [Halorussus]|uniref:hypothetical protein n=1 Tax=Halorussus TaxID=1070314 RepID=UPI0013B386BD|nr:MULTISPECIES: hypothetical protein [Halorussus]NHN60958.1 hypothetical protein [Halorussus sp. JP-T4]